MIFEAKTLKKCTESIGMYLNALPPGIPCYEGIKISV